MTTDRTLSYYETLAKAAAAHPRGSVVGRLAARPYQPGDVTPKVGTMTLVSGANADVESDQHRSYGWCQVIGYSDDLQFVCLQTPGCWPTVERMANCWFAKIPDPGKRQAAGKPVDVRSVIATVIADLRASGDTGMVENLLEADAAIAKEAIVSDDLLKAAIQVWAACRNGTEPDLIELADSIDAAGGKELRKAALAGSTP